MKILVLGGDGYLGWPTSMALAARGHRILAVDNYLRRTIAQQTNSESLIANPNLEQRAAIYASLTGCEMEVAIADCTDIRVMEGIFRRFAPDAVIHFAEQPSAPYSMRGYEEGQMTLRNNITTTFNVAWLVMNHAPGCHIVKLGTMGEYGTPNIDIEEGWIEIEKDGRKQKFLYPRQAGSLYHTSKVMDTDLLWFYVRTHGIAVTDLMQGPVYGISSAESVIDERLMPNFHYDDIFGTVINRFLAQAAVGLPLTVYGKGGQTRGYLNLLDTLQCIELAIANPARPGEMRILNQFTEQFTVNEIAARVQQAGRLEGLDVKIQSIPNPRRELEEHYYLAKHHELLNLGLKPHLMTDVILADMLRSVLKYRSRIDPGRVQPRVSWS